MNDTYTAPSGGAIYAGMIAPSSVPAWRQGLALYETVAIPHVGTLASINPENNPAINPNHPAVSPWRGNTGFTAVIRGYNGGAYDDTTGDYWLPLQGGHQDYAGNEPYKFNILADTPQWQMIRNPSGAIGNVINLNDGQSATGLYSDGRLRAVHSYNYNVAHGGRVFIGALTASYPDVGLVRKCYELNATTGEAELLCDYSTSGSNITGYGGTAYDYTRNKLYLTGQGTTRIVEIDVTAKTFAHITPLTNIFGGYSCGTYAASVDRVVFAVSQRTETEWSARRGLAVINPATGVVIYPQCEDFPAFLGGAIGAAWVGNALWLWDNATNTNNFVVVTPSNPADLSQPWTVSTVTSTGAAIPARTPEGTYNRLQYSARLGGLLLINGVNQQMYFTRTN